MIIVLYSAANHSNVNLAGRWAIRHQVDHESADYAEHEEDEGSIWWFDWKQTVQHIEESL